MLKAGWHAHRLDAPGKFLLSAPEHDIPRRARTYLLNDEGVQRTAARHAPNRPQLDPVSAAALETHSGQEEAAIALGNNERPEAPQDAERALSTALDEATDEGASVHDLMAATGMGKRWVYYRVGALVNHGRAVQTARGRWRTAPVSHDSA
jgi:S-DNA-T family DNA segregation ATPase FtsK/SpoIIIE